MTIPQEIYDMIDFLEHIKRGWMKAFWWNFIDLNGKYGSIHIEFWENENKYELFSYLDIDTIYVFRTKTQLLTTLTEIFDKIEGIKE